MGLRPFQGWPSRKAGSLRPSFTALDTPRRAPMHRLNHPPDPGIHLKHLARRDSFHVTHEHEVVGKGPHHNAPDDPKEIHLIQVRASVRQTTFRNNINN
jgi:hypothetical protein